MNKKPIGWEIKTIKQFAYTRTGGTPSRFNNSYWKNGKILWLRSGEIQNNIIERSKEKITKLGLKNSAAKIFTKGTILIAITGQGKTRGKTSLLKIPASTNQSIVGIQIFDDKIFNKYIWYYLQNQYEKIRSNSQGSNQAGLTLKIINDYEVLIPTMKEQQKIVSILSKIDILIETTVKIIEKNEKLMYGLMQKMMSGGFEHNKFKKIKKHLNTQFKIPLEWNIIQFDKIIQNKQINKSKIKRSNYLKIGKYPIIDQSHQLISGYADDPSLLNDILPVLVFGDHTLIIKFIDFPFIIGTDGTKLIHVDESKYFLKFIYYSILNKNLKSEGYKRHFSKLKKQYLSIPPYSEQQKIASILSNIDLIIDNNKHYKEKLIILKKSLMQKLFTGKIRINS